MRALWREDSSSFAGQSVRFENAYFYPKPPRDLPILIGGESETAMKRVARLAAGRLPLPLEEARGQIRCLKTLVRDHGRDPTGCGS